MKKILFGFLFTIVLGIALIPIPVFADRTISIERIVPTETQKLMQVFSELEVYPQVLPQNIRSSTILNDQENISQMTVGHKNIWVQAEVKHSSPSPDMAVLEIISGDLKGTKLTGVFSSIVNNQGKEVTRIHATLDLKISWYFSLATFFISDENIESMLNTGLMEFSTYANNPRTSPETEMQSEQSCFLLWCW